MAMTNWVEIQASIDRKFHVLDKQAKSVTVGFEWDDGRSQPVTISAIEFASEDVLIVTSPIVPYSRDAADYLLKNVGMPLKNTADGCISVAHSMHISTMDVSSCLVAIAAVAETADEIEKNVTDGKDGGLNAKLSDSSTDSQNPQLEGVISSGQYVVGSDVQPGLYRFAGYAARLDSTMNIITNESTRSGLGLISINPHDAYFEVSGEAISISSMPFYDVLINGPRGGMYLVGVDIPAGRYKIHGDGASAYYATYDKNLNLLNNDYNRGTLILTLSTSTFAMEFTGRLEQL
jgi:hypothetical protein